MQDDDALDAEATSATSPWSNAEPDAPEHPAETGRFGSTAAPLEPATRRAVPARTAVAATAAAATVAAETATKGFSLFAWAGGAAFAALAAVGGYLYVSGGDDTPAAPPATSPVTFPASSGPASSGDMPETTPTTMAVAFSGLPTVAPPPVDATVPLSPGRVVVEQETIDFKGAETTQRLRLTNSGGGEADWQVSVGSGSGLRIPTTDGRIRPGEVVEVEIILDRASGPSVSDWSERLLVLGGGNTSPSRVLVRIFPV